jgi:hypothetical protein
LAKAVDESPPSAAPSSAVHLKELIKPGDIQVIPPEKPGGHGVTQKELEKIEDRRSKLDPDNIEVIPPVGVGAKGVTLKGIKIQQHDQISEALRDRNIVPLYGLLPK